MEQIEKSERENCSSLLDNPDFMNAFERGKRRFQEEGKKRERNRGSLRNNPKFIEAVKKGRQRFSEEGKKEDFSITSRSRKSSRSFLGITFQPKLF